MSHSLSTVTLPRFATVITAAKQPRQRPNAKTQSGKQKTTTTITPGVPAATAMKTMSGFNSRNKEPTWQCVQNCGACCKLEKGPNFPSAEEIFDDPSDIELFNSLVGSDGWCIHFDKSTRKCSIYADRPYFCRVEPDIFEILYGIETKKFNKEACSCCIDTIKAVYGSTSKELENFNAAIWSST
ncbi:hypothetical protein AABB24_015549 [Solanum stoloniferum]|uniref:Uncharacterized protein n=3 Tax=Solanum TaxID=4107 RepID=A0AAF0ZMQ4_SOLVR|nr:uncharacterized protein LOC125833380 [Solanum verrucosum]WMV44851.1 hypothetical protein MTR67_038236 [Solanum verrucosum]